MNNNGVSPNSENCNGFNPNNPKGKNTKHNVLGSQG
jgi:hypothetical protein